MEKGFNFVEKYGDLPVGWEIKTVGQLFDFHPTATYSRAVMSDERDEESDLQYIHYGDIHTKFDTFLDTEKMSIPYIKNELRRGYELIENGDLIVVDTSEDYDGVGKCIEAVNVGDSKIISGLHTLMLRSKGDDYIRGIKSYMLNSEQVRANLLRYVSGIKVYSLSKNSLEKLKMPIPPKKEQETILSILLKVDNSIEAINNSITAAEKLKKSLMQNLLTGKMKPDGTKRGESEYYVDEKFGRIPVGWRIKKLKDIAKVERGKFGHRPRNDKRFYNGDYPFVQTSDVVESVFFLKGASQSLNKLGASVSKRFPKGTIIMTIAANIGYVAITNYDVYFPDSLIGIVCNEKIIEPELLLLQLMLYKNVLDAQATESAQKNINYSNLKPLPILYPDSKAAQQEMVTVIKSVFEEIESKKNEIATLQRLKKSLMQNLLTGRVRIPT